MVLQNFSKEQKKSAENSLSESWRFPREGVVLEPGVPFGREGSANGREAPVVNKEWSCVFRGPEDGR